MIDDEGVARDTRIVFEMICKELDVKYPKLIQRRVETQMRVLHAHDVAFEDMARVAFFCRETYRRDRFLPLLDLTYIFDPACFAGYLAAASIQQAQADAIDESNPDSYFEAAP
jgi:hypothetical protein